MVSDRESGAWHILGLGSCFFHLPLFYYSVIYIIAGLDFSCRRSLGLALQTKFIIMSVFNLAEWSTIL
jgi:hypothetical protein